jgi:glycerophosphoryl diester phosphodiesterase
LALERGHAASGVVVTSFEQDAVEACVRAGLGIRVGLLVWDTTGMRAIEMFRESGADFLAPDHQMLDDQTLRAAEAAAIALLPWTVNDGDRVRRLLASPAVTGIITDRTEDALAIRGGRRGSTGA